MNQAPYSYVRDGDSYMFISKGKRDIVKGVDFVMIDNENLFNLAFGELLMDGSIDDTINSNNGDVIRIMSTVIHITVDFFNRRPYSKVFFAGSTRLRTAMYHRILRTYYETFNLNFRITATVWDNKKVAEVEFDPASTKKHFSFFIRKRN